MDAKIAVETVEKMLSEKLGEMKDSPAIAFGTKGQAVGGARWAVGAAREALDAGLMGLAHRAAGKKTSLSMSAEKAMAKAAQLAKAAQAKVELL